MFNRSSTVALAGNVWCYEQVCLAEMFKLPKMLLANLLIARVTARTLFNNLKIKIVWKK